ncbi:hypothetical protein [Lysobacter gummosus]|uniref:hypothetical protein n=1 Tax=Lysobacter gummosus TaxID=262324 RepID=UPI00363302B9
MRGSRRPSAAPRPRSRSKRTVNARRLFAHRDRRRRRAGDSPPRFAAGILGTAQSRALRSFITTEL